MLRGAPDDPDRDRFVLSKGHAALALYAALHASGRLSREQLESYCGDATLLGTHPEHELDGVDFSTGSLGHGLSIGAGAALAARMQGSERRVFVLVSDAELQRGLALGGGRCSPRTTGSRSLVASWTPTASRRSATRGTCSTWSRSPSASPPSAGRPSRSTATTSTRSPAALDVASASAPRAVIARTTFGKGVSYMEGLVKWHYWPMSDDDYAAALAEVSA